MENFRMWYIRNQDAISWFLVGFLTMGGLTELGKENYLTALIDFGLAYTNYYFTRVRLE